MQDLQEVTQEIHYENYRSEKLAGGGQTPARKITRLVDFRLPHVLIKCTVAFFLVYIPHFTKYKKTSRLLSLIFSSCLWCLHIYQMIIHLNVWIKVLLFVDISHTSWRKSQVYDDVDAYIKVKYPKWMFSVVVFVPNIFVFSFWWWIKRECKF